MTDDFSSPARERELELVAGDSCEGPAAVEERQGKALGSLYNLVKSVAKLDDRAAAIQKLTSVLSKAGTEIDQKNAKGSTALHACGYLRRWDLAKILLDAGASPTLRNSAGHSFFLTAVREPLSPWRELLAGHPELVEKHERFLAKHAPKAALAKTERGSGFSLDATAGQRALAAHVAAGCWEEPLPPLSGADLASAALDAQGQLRVAREMPLDQALSLAGRGLKLSTEAQGALAERCAEKLPGSTAGEWGALTLGAHEGVKNRLMNDFLRAGEEEAVLGLAGAGWLADEDFIEQCEEFERYDLADALIDLQAARRLAPGREPALAKPSKAGAAKKKASPKKFKEGRPARPGAVRKAGSRKPAMIAKLDAPLREASDYGYQERKAPSKAPVIIVKKARSILRDPRAGEE